MPDNLELLTQITQMVSSINPAMVDPVLMQSGDPTLVLDNLQRQVDASSDLKNRVNNLDSLINKELMKVQNLIDSQRLQNAQMSGQQVPQAPHTGQPAMASKKVFNLKKVAQGWMPPINMAPANNFAPPAANNAELMTQPQTDEGVTKDIVMKDDNEIEGVLNFNDASDLKNWLDTQGSRFEAEDKLMELVADDQKETITSAMQDYFETDLTEEEKLVLATEIWPILPDFTKEDTPDVQENIMELPYSEASIDKIIKESEENIKKMAQKDVNKTKKANAFNLKKTAQHKSMNNVILYGPEQVQMDAFTRQPASTWSLVERNKGFGLVVDDVWDIDWEAAWRGNIMDKYSRAYRDKDGNWVGGYIQKRFEVDKWIPEGNNYQLKPGELRRPYIPEQRSVEARMVAQRASEDCPYEGTEKTKPFNWKEASSKKKR